MFVFMEIQNLYYLFLEKENVSTDTRNIIKDSIFFALKLKLLPPSLPFLWYTFKFADCIEHPWGSWPRLNSMNEYVL